MEKIEHEIKIIDKIPHEHTDQIAYCAVLGKPFPAKFEKLGQYYKDCYNWHRAKAIQHSIEVIAQNACLIKLHSDCSPDEAVSDAFYFHNKVRERFGLPPVDKELI